LDFKSFDMASLKRFQRLFGVNAVRDLNAFLENLPQTAGQNVLIAGGIAWMLAASLGLYAAVQTQALTEQRAKLQEVQSLKPSVPTIRDVPVKKEEVTAFANVLKQSYPRLTIKQQGASIQISAGSTTAFGTFREAIGHVQNGGEGWRVNTERLCVGRECNQNQLGALLKINKVTVDKPR
jgi:hypothetical protein